MNRKVLIIDGDITATASISDFLSSQNLTPLVARDGISGIAMFQKEHPRLVIIERNLPKLDGLNVCRQIRNTKKGKTIPIIIVGDDDDKQQLRKKAIEDYGADNFIAKPFDMKTLESTITGFIRDPLETADVSGETKTPAQSWLPVPGNGKLTNHPFPVLLKACHDAQITGVLTCSRDTSIKSVYFKDGNLVYAMSNANSDMLFTLLLKTGKINEKQAKQVLKMRKQSGGMEKGILLKLGIVKLNELPNIVKLQNENIILSLFTWNQGQFSFVQDSTFVDRITLLDLNYLELVQRGIALISEEKDLDALLPDGKTVLKKSSIPQGFPKKILSHPGFERIYSLVDGAKNIETMLGKSPLNAFNTKKILAFMTLSGLLSYPGSNRQFNRQPEPDNAARATKPEESSAKDQINIEDDAGEVRPELLNMMEKIQSGDYYKILDVPKNASTADIKKAYFALAKQFHPDSYRIAGSTKEKEYVGKIFPIINEVYYTLSTRDKRRAYDADPGGSSKKKVYNPQEEAEQFYLSGKDLMERGMVRESIEYFKRAVYLNPDMADYLHAFARSLLRTGDEDLLFEAKSFCLKALNLDGKNADYYVTLGLIYKAAKIFTSARKQFQTALKYDPDHSKAKRELNKLEPQ